MFRDNLPDSKYIVVQKTDGSTQYDCIPWIWYATPEQTFRIYSDVHDIPQAPNTRVFRISRFTYQSLVSQLLSEQKHNRPVFVIGFQEYYPTNTPDLSHGYSIGIRKCDDCTTDHVEVYWFNYQATLSDQQPIVTDEMWQAKYIDFNPETFSFSTF